MAYSPVIEAVRTEVFIDKRSSIKQIWDGSKDPTLVKVILIMGVAAALLEPALLFLYVLIGGILGVRSILDPDHSVLPVHLPVRFKKITDKRNIKPGGLIARYGKAEGSFFFGNIREKGRFFAQEVWAKGAQLLVHGLVIATTGSGKTEMLISLATNFIAKGAGVQYLDFKAAPELKFQFLTMVRLFGRDEHARILDYIPAKTVTENVRNWNRNSNTINEFSGGHPNTGVQIMNSTLPESSGDHAIFSERAMSAITALLPCLYDMRDQGLIDVNPRVINDWFTLDKFAQLANGDIIINNRKAPPEYSLNKESVYGIRSFLTGAVNYSLGIPPDDQAEDVKKQFGYGRSYFQKAMTMMASDYAHIFSTPKPEIVPQDIIFNDRILLVAMPAIGRDAEDLEKLGMLTLASMVQGVREGLGDGRQGTIEETLDNLPIDKSNPSCMIIDELAAAFPPNLITTLYTQARGLGMSIWVGSQDIPGLWEKNKKDTEQIFSNAINKFLGTTLDPNATSKWFIDLAGKTYTDMAAGMERHEGVVGDHRRRSFNTSYQHVDRLTQDDLGNLKEGQFFYFTGQKFRAIQTYWHGLDSERDYIKEWSLNVGIPNSLPSAEIVSDIRKQVHYRKLTQSRIESIEEFRREHEAYINYLKTPKAKFWQFWKKQEKVYEPLLPPFMDLETDETIVGMINELASSQDLTVFKKLTTQYFEKIETTPSSTSVENEDSAVVDDLLSNVHIAMEGDKPGTVSSEVFSKPALSSPENVSTVSESRTIGKSNLDVSLLEEAEKKVSTAKKVEANSPHPERPIDTKGSEDSTMSARPAEDKVDLDSHPYLDAEEISWIWDPNQIFNLHDYKDNVRDVGAMLGMSLEGLKSDGEIIKAFEEHFKYPDPSTRVVVDEDLIKSVNKRVDELLNS